MAWLGVSGPKQTEQAFMCRVDLVWFIGAEERREGCPRGARVAAALRGWLNAGGSIK